MTALVAAMGVAVLAGTPGLDALYGEGRTAFIGPLLLFAYLYLPAQLVWLGVRERRASGSEAGSDAERTGPTGTNGAAA
jgi:hypothetical protein